MELTDNLDRDTLKKLHLAAKEYGEKSIDCKTVKRLWKKKKDSVIIKRVNTPEKIPVTYIFLKNNNGKKFWFSFVCLKGREGTSFVCEMKEMDCIIVFKSHVFKRYRERHGWEGDLEDCENHILLHSFLLWYDVDKYTGEVNAYFDNGMFIGKYDKEEKIMRLNTYIDESIMYKNQKIRAKWQALQLDDARKYAYSLFESDFVEIINKIDNLELIGKSFEK